VRQGTDRDILALIIVTFAHIVVDALEANVAEHQLDLIKDESIGASNLQYRKRIGDSRPAPDEVATLKLICGLLPGPVPSLQASSPAAVRTARAEMDLLDIDGSHYRSIERVVACRDGNRGCPQDVVYNFLYGNVLPSHCQAFVLNRNDLAATKCYREGRQRQRGDYPSWGSI
jgi:hypothetical protein